MITESSSLSQHIADHLIIREQSALPQKKKLRGKTKEDPLKIAVGQRQDCEQYLRVSFSVSQKPDFAALPSARQCFISKTRHQGKAQSCQEVACSIIELLNHLRERERESLQDKNMWCAITSCYTAGDEAAVSLLISFFTPFTDHLKLLQHMKLSCGSSPSLSLSFIFTPAQMYRGFPPPLSP